MIQSSFFGGDTTFIDNYHQVDTFAEALDYVMNTMPPFEHEWDVRENAKGGAVIWTRYSGQEVHALLEGKRVELRNKDGIMAR